MAEDQALQTTENGGNDGSAVNILPYPPALEFPYPYHEATRHESNLNPVSDIHQTSVPLEPTKSSSPRPPRLKRAAVTERPMNSQRQSLLNLQRRSTLEPQNRMFDTALWESDTDSSSENEQFSRKRRYGHANSMPQSAETPQGKSQDLEDPYRRAVVKNNDYKTRCKVSKRDGRLNISLKDIANKGYLAKTLETTLQHHVHTLHHHKTDDKEISHDAQKTPRPQLIHAGTTSTIKSAASMASIPPTLGPIPQLNICIMVIGSRGDIQPFLRLGKILVEDHGHRVRIATHPAFRDFVENESKLEFFSVGGDPAELMAFMVKNPGLIPKAKTIREGEVAKRRETMYEMFKGFWRACINTTDDERDLANLKMMGDRDSFVADAIIANPPSFAHVHCAERLGIPLHLMFTFPMSPTRQFPHPLANIKPSNVDCTYTNFMSYPLVEMMTWQGLGDLVNRFRVKSLGLEPISTLWQPGQLHRMRVPYSYLWSPGLIPKPPDWGPEIDISGFVFLDLASEFQPSKELTEFLEAGDPPLYIGFGSIVVDDPNAFTRLIFEAVAQAGVRALVSKGWGGLGDEGNTPRNIFMLGNTPHDWLFPRVSAVVHHGGAGSTAIGLKCGKPTMVVPFFGDQPFWGAMVAKSGAGAEPVPYKQLTADILAESIKKLLTPECQAHAKEMAEKIAAEGDGATNAVDSFHQKLPLRGNHSMRCSILEDQVAVWWLKRSHVRLSSLAAEILVQKGKIRWTDLGLVRHYDWNDFEGPGEPLTGAGGAIVGSLGGVVRGIGGTPRRWALALKRKQNQEKERKERKSHGSEREKKAEADFDSIAPKPLSKVTSRLHAHDKHNGSTKGPELPPANLGEGIVKEELAKNVEIGREPPGPIPFNTDQVKHKSTEDSLIAAPDPDDLNVEVGLAAGTRKGVSKSGKAIVNAPIDISVALAQGFHNAPRLWGDGTVRAPRRINGFKSGMRAARDELVLGVYDGFTGVIRQPMHGAKNEGALGFVKGVGKGLGGLVLKDLAALAGVSAYPLRGLQKEIGKGREPTGLIRRAHIIDGQKKLTSLSEEELESTIKEVFKGWKIISDVLSNAEELEGSGLKGRISYHRHQKKWKRNAVFENVEQMGQALQAAKQGKDIATEFAQHRQQVDEAQSLQVPRNEIGGISKSTPRSSKEFEGRTGKHEPICRSVDHKVAVQKDQKQPNTTDGAADDIDSPNQKGSTEMAGRQSGTAVTDQALRTKAADLGGLGAPMTESPSTSSEILSNQNGILDDTRKATTHKGEQDSRAGLVKQSLTI